MNDFEEGNGDGGYGGSYMTVEGCSEKSSELIRSVRDNRQILQGTPGSDGGLLHKVTVLVSEWNTFKGMMKFLIGGSFLINILTLLRMFNVI